MENLFEILYKMRKKEIGLINNYLFLPYYQTIIYLISWIENQSLIINSLGDKIIIPPKDIYSFDSWGFLVPPSQIYLLINDNRPIITLYSIERKKNISPNHTKIKIYKKKFSNFSFKSLILYDTAN